MNKVIEAAKAEIGMEESPPNTNLNKYGEWFGLNGVPWCGIFVSYCYYMGGRPLVGLGWPKGFAGCQVAVDYFKKKDMITKKPQPGDIVFFDWNADGRYDHTGIFVEKISDGKFKSIEGNTSYSNNSNGGEVMERIRSFSYAIFASVNNTNQNKTI